MSILESLVEVSLADQEDFLTYGSTAKNLYLLLLEDL